MKIQRASGRYLLLALLALITVFGSYNVYAMTFTCHSTSCVNFADCEGDSWETTTTCNIQCLINGPGPHEVHNGGKAGCGTDEY